MLTIYHNPRCSKSRQTLELIEKHGVTPQVIDYQKDPLSGARIETLARLLDAPVAGLLRRGEQEFCDADDLPALDDDAALAAWIARHPRVLQRPIVVDESGQRAVLGRPPENVLRLLGI